MDLLFIVLFFCFFLFLYVIYELGRDDFVIMRKNIPMEKIFNAAFVVTLLSLISSRLFYVVAHPNSSFINPLVFLVFPYYPGLSLSGGIVGGILFSILVLRRWGMPVGRIVDFFTVGFITIFPLGFFLSAVTSSRKINGEIFLVLFIYVLFFLTTTKFILPKTLEGKIKDGSLSAITILSFTIIYVLSNVLINSKNIFNFENFLSILIIIVSFAFLFQHEGIEKVFRK